jgi:hypothetical protein
MTSRWSREHGRVIYLGVHHSEEEAAHVWDLSAICLGLGTARLNFPASEYEAGGKWEEEAREAARVDIDELKTIWSQRARDGVHLRPLNRCWTMLMLHRSATRRILACKWYPWQACICGPGPACTFDISSSVLRAPRVSCFGGPPA